MTTSAYLIDAHAENVHDAYIYGYMHMQYVFNMHLCRVRGQYIHMQYLRDTHTRYVHDEQIQMHVYGV
jgi:hypothetical protein